MKSREPRSIIPIARAFLLSLAILNCDATRDHRLDTPGDSVAQQDSARRYPATDQTWELERIPEQGGEPLEITAMTKPLDAMSGDLKPASGQKVALHNRRYYEGKMGFEIRYEVNDGVWTTFPDGVYLDNTNNSLLSLSDIHYTDYAAIGEATALSFGALNGFLEDNCPLKQSIADSSAMPRLAEVLRRYRKKEEFAKATDERILAELPDCRYTLNSMKARRQYIHFDFNRQSTRVLMVYPEEIGVENAYATASSRTGASEEAHANMESMRDYLRRSGDTLSHPLSPTRR